MLTIEDMFRAEAEVKGSRFIAHLVPIVVFDETLERLRVEHKKASHHVTAFRTINAYDQITEISKDDGEPAGTSGMPVLKTLQGASLINVGMIVTRYFGGTKLGTGGLARAYSGTSNAAIQMARLIPWERIVSFEINASFAESAEIERQVSIVEAYVTDRVFNENGVTLKVEGAEARIAQLKRALTR